MPHAGSTRNLPLQSGRALKPNVTKTFAKGTIGLAVFSLFLEVNPSNFANYLIFLGIAYATLFAYMLFKRSAVYGVDNNGVSVKRPFGKDIDVPYENVQGLSYAQGVLAKRFGCGTVYIELKKGKGTHRALGGGEVLALRDVPRPVEVYNEISNMVGPFAPVV
jgi:uncharacterized membrane protein YdbT with pleckstrin-like domain